MKKVFIWVGTDKGGYELRTLAFANFISNKGVDVTIGVYHKIESNLKQIVIKPLFKTKKLTGFNNLFISLKLDKTFLDKYDIVYGKFLRSTGAIKISRVAGDSRRTIQPSFLSRSAYKVLLFFDKIIYRNSDAVVACSNDAMKFIHDMGGKPIKSSNFVDTNKFKAIELKLPRDNTDKFKVLYVGRHDPIKNLDSLKKAVESLGPKFMLTTVGVNEWVNPETLNEYYNLSNLTVLPSHYESFGSVVLESLATCCPVLVSNNVTAGRELPEYVSICDTSWKSIRATIYLIEHNYEQILKNTVKGRDHVRAERNKDSVLGNEWNNILEVKKR
jgi:glycosyltransferase involved in cell wall biosynthesis